MREINFSGIDDYFRRYLLGTAGLKSRDQKRREEKQKRGSQPFEPGREPVRASDSMEQLFGEFNWNSKLSEAELFSNWEAIVGTDNAAASYPEQISSGILSIRCRSTAWATQLRLLGDQVLLRVQEKHPELNISEIRFIGPTAPSWKKGPRSVPGRGPRDTYG